MALTKGVGIAWLLQNVFAAELESRSFAFLCHIARKNEHRNVPIGFLFAQFGEGGEAADPGDPYVEQNKVGLDIEGSRYARGAVVGGDQFVTDRAEAGWSGPAQFHGRLR